LSYILYRIVRRLLFTSAWECFQLSITGAVPLTARLAARRVELVVASDDALIEGDGDAVILKRNVWTANGLSGSRFRPDLQKRETGTVSLSVGKDAHATAGWEAGAPIVVRNGKPALHLRQFPGRILRLRLVIAGGAILFSSRLRTVFAGANLPCALLAFLQDWF
jgi:hypothetical protein